MKTSLLALLTIICSCNNKGAEVVKTDSITFANDTANTIKDTTFNDEVNDSVINIRFQKDSVSTTVSGKMKGINHPVTVYIPIKQGKQLTASLTTEDSIANIRINQIFTPDGKADGPFGRDLKRAIHQQGMYKLIIGENLMQGDEYKGKFTLRITVK